MATSATRTKRASIIDRIEIEHGFYRIVAGNAGTVCKAVAYLGAAGIRPVEAVEGESVDTAVALIKDVLDSRLAELRQSRRDGVPTSVEFHEALAALAPKMRQTAVELLLDSTRLASVPLSMEDLSRRSKLDPAAALSELQKLGRKLAGLLDLDLQDPQVDKRFLPLLALARIENVDQVGMPLLVFHEELREAIRNLPPERPEPRLLRGR